MATSAGKLSMENANAMITVRGSEEERPWSLSGRLQAVTHENPTGDAEDGETTIRLGLGDACGRAPRLSAVLLEVGSPRPAAPEIVGEAIAVEGGSGPGAR